MYQLSTSASPQPPTMPPLSSHQSAHTIECIIGRTIVYYEASSSIFHRCLCCPSIGGSSDDCLASTSPPIEDRRRLRGECAIGRMGRDRKGLFLIVRLHLTPSLHLYTARQEYNHREEYDVNNLYISKYKGKLFYLLFYLYYSAIITNPSRTLTSITPTSLHLYMARQGYNHRQSMCMIYVKYKVQR